MKKKIALCSMLAVLWILMLIAPGIAIASKDLVDGTYSADYLILKAENDSVSMANDYWEKPATVTIIDGKAKIRVTINHSFWVTEFKVPEGDGYVDSKVISTNKKADTRIVEFSAEVTKPILSKIHVTVEEIDYDHDYTIRFVFDMESFKLVKAASKGKTVAPTEKPKPTTAPIKPAKPATTNPKTTNPKTTVSTGSIKSTSTEAGAVGAVAGSEVVKPTETTEADEAASETITGSSTDKEVTVAAGTTDTGTTSEVEPSAQVDVEAAQQEELLPSTVPATDGVKTEEDTTKTETAVETGQSQQVEQTLDDTKNSGDTSAAQTIAAVGEGSELPEEKSSSGMNSWTPLAAVALLAVGAVFIWRRKTK